MNAPGFLSEPALSNAEGVEMTDVGLVNEYRSLSRAPDRHSEPKARNPEAGMLPVRISCYGLSFGTPFGLAQDRLSRGSHARE